MRVIKHGRHGEVTLVGGVLDVEMAIVDKRSKGISIDE